MMLVLPVENVDGHLEGLPFKLLSTCIRIGFLKFPTRFVVKNDKSCGEVPKWLYRARLEIELSCEEQGTWVRIPPSPPVWF